MAKGNGVSRGNVGAAENGAAIAPLDSFLTAGHKAVETWTAIGTELIEFGAARFGHGVEISRAIARSSSFGEAIELQAKFAQSMVSDVLNEAGKLAEMSTRPLIESFVALRPTARSEIPSAEPAA